MAADYNGASTVTKQEKITRQLNTFLGIRCVLWLSYFFLFSYFPFLVWLNNFFLKFCFIFLIKIFEKTLTLRKAAFLNCTFLDFRLLYSTCTIVSRSKNIKLLIRNVHAFLFLSRLKKIGLHRSEFGGFITLQTL